MAEFFVQNSLNDKLAVKFNMTLRYFALSSSEGDHKWTLEIGTTYPDVAGNSIPPQRVHGIDAINFDEVIEEATAEICAVIDWGELERDVKAPFVSFNSIEDGSTVPIDSFMKLVISDELLSAGINISEMKIILNNSMVDFDITDEVSVTGDPYEYTLQWRPPMIVKGRYE